MGSRYELARRAQAQYEDYNLDSNPSYSYLDPSSRNPFRSDSGFVADEWSGTTSLPESSGFHQQSFYESAPSAWSGGQQELFEGPRIEKRPRLGSEGVAFERLLNAMCGSSRQQLPPLHGRSPLLDSNLHRQYSAAQVMESQAQQQLLHNHHQLPVPIQHQPMFHLPYQQQVAQPLYSSSAQARLQNQALKLQAMEAAYLKCSQLLSLFIQEQRSRPRENTVQFWKSLFRTFFSERATQRWCLSCYNSTHIGRHAQGLFPMEHWRCNLCGVEPGRGFETRVDVLPRLFKIKFDSGLLEELFFLELPDEKCILSSGHIVFEYSRVVHESSFQEVRIIKHGRLRVTFNPFFKISSWEFCTKSHEEVIPRNNLLPHAQQLSSLVREVEKENSDTTSVEKLKQQCDAFNIAAKQLAVKLDAPSVNDLGFSKRYVRCVQIAEVVDCMEDLITFSKATGLGPIETLDKFPNPRKRAQVEDSSPQSSSITHLQYQPSFVQQQQQQTGGTVARMPSPTISYNQLPPEVRAQLLQQQQSLIQQSLSRGELRSKISGGLNQRQLQQQQQQVMKTNSAHSNQSLPGTPQSEMSDLRSNAS